MMPGPVVSPPDGGWGWVVVAASLGIVGLIFGVSRSGYSVLYSHMMESLNSSTADTGWLMSSFTSTVFISGLVTSSLTDRYGHRPVAVIGALFGGIFLSLGALATNIWFLCLTSGVLAGVFSGQLLYVALILPHHYFVKRRAIACGLVTYCSVVHMALAPLMEILAENFGWRGALLISGGIYLHQVIFACAYRPINLASLEKERNSTFTTGTRRTKLWQEVVSILRETFNIRALHDVRVALCFISILLFKAGNLAGFSQVVNRALSLGISPRQASMLPTFMSGGGVAGMTVVVIVLEVTRLPISIIYSGVLIGASFTMALIPLARAFETNAVLTTLLGFCTEVGYFCHLTCLRDVATVSRLGQLLSLNMFCWGLIALVCVPFSGWLYDVTSDFSVPFFAAGAVIFCGACCSSIMTLMTHCRQRQIIEYVDS